MCPLGSAHIPLINNLGLTCYFQSQYFPWSAQQWVNETHDAYYLSALTLLTNSIHHNYDIIKQRLDMCRDSLSHNVNLWGQRWGMWFDSTLPHTGEKWQVRQRHTHIRGQRMWVFILWTQIVSHTQANYCLFRYTQTGKS